MVLLHNSEGISRNAVLVTPPTDIALTALVGRAVSACFAERHEAGTLVKRAYKRF
jgi:hypothetical protein